MLEGNHPFVNAGWEPEVAIETWESLNRLNDLARIEGPTIPIIGRRFYHIADERLLKVGSGEEEAWMSTLARHVLEGSSNVPRTRAFVQMPNSVSAILMDRVPGVPLSTVWNDISDPQRANITNQLCELLFAMRRPSFEYAGRPGRRPYVLPEELGSSAHDFCPDVEAWNASRARAIMANTVDASHAATLREQQYKLVTGTTADRFVLTHGDLSERNIMVDPDSLNVTGLIDWEDANVAPSYFEYVAARLSSSHLPQWRSVLLRVLEKVLERECEEMRTSREKEELVRWKALVDVERYAQGLNDECTWTFDSTSAETS